jgi:hypothetical protein
MMARRELKASGAKRIARASRNPATRKARPDKMNKPSELPIRDLERATGERATGDGRRATGDGESNPHYQLGKSVSLVGPDLRMS